MVYFTVAQTLGDYRPTIYSRMRVTRIEGRDEITTFQESPVGEGPNFYTVSMPERDWLKMRKDLQSE